MNSLKNLQDNRDVLVTLLRTNKWDYQAYRKSQTDEALLMIKGITGKDDTLYQKMLKNHDFTQDDDQTANSYRLV